MKRIDGIWTCPKAPPPRKFFWGYITSKDHFYGTKDGGISIPPGESVEFAVPLPYATDTYYPYSDN